MDEQEKLWETSEILQVLYGLMSIYHQKNWLAKIFFKPYFVAVQAMILIVGGDQILSEVVNEDLTESIEKFLSNPREGSNP